MKESSKKDAEWKAYRNWLESPSGQLLLQLERKQIGDSVHTLFGHHLLVLGEPAYVECIKDTLIRHIVLLNPKIIPDESLSQVISRQDKLPLASDSIDLVYLAHSLEFNKNPHEVLRESYRVLIPEGHILITGFNPWSLWGIWTVFMRLIHHVPWQGHALSLFRLKDWLSLLGFDIITVKTYLFRPPIQHQKTQKFLVWLETMGRLLWPFWGGCYWVLAKKRVVTLTQVRTRWSTKRRLIPAGMIETGIRTRNL